MQFRLVIPGLEMGFPSSVNVDVGAGDHGNSLPNFTNEGLHEVNKSPPGN